MSETTPMHLPTAAVTKRSRRPSVIWIIPIAAVAIGAWLAWDTLSKRGPTIRISFDSGEGLQAGQSQLKFKDIVFGTVERLRLADDHTHVVATVSTTRDAEPLLTDRTEFWVVKPRLFAGNLSGLETVLSGSYIGMLPPMTGGKRQRDFVGREDPPILQAHVPGQTFLVKAARLGSISLGSPVFFRDLSVGEVLGWDIADMAESVTIRTFVRAPFDRYVTDQSRFWNASGISVKLQPTGLDVQLESLRALLLGGIAFDTPADQTATAASLGDHVFPLFADRDAANASSYSRKISVVSYFQGSVRGLGPGSEVTTHGLVVGHVKEVRLSFDPVKDEILAPVRYDIEPERILGVGAKAHFSTPEAAAEAVVNKGLRASLQTSSLLTGQQMVTLDFVTDAPPAEVRTEGSDIVLPSVKGGGFAGIEASATALFNQVSQLPLKQIGDNLDGILRNVNDATSGPRLRQAVADLSAAVASVRDLIAQLENGLNPTMKQLPELSANLQKTLTNVNKLLLSVESGYGDNTPFNRDLERLLVQLNDAVRSIRSLADLLARHPEALIKGRPTGGVE
jgi:paraquat-inducible protein B